MKKHRKYFLLLILSVLSCVHKPGNQVLRYGEEPDDVEIPIYSFAVHPLHNPSKLIHDYQPLIDYLNAKEVGAKFTIEASRNYALFEEKYKSGKPDFLLSNPWQTLQAMNFGYTVIAMAGEPNDFKGIFIVRKDGGIRIPQDLKGKAVSYPAPTALAACIMPQYFLYRAGLNVSTDIENKYVGSQESSIMNVYMKLTVAGATWPPPWRAFRKDHPNEASELKVIWETEPLINNSVMVHNRIPSNIIGHVQKLLTELDATEEGRLILAGMETARFLPASDTDYNVVHDYIGQFEKEVRKIEIR
ncbi:MAG: phosphonate ABC transporter substrate-binding protein [Bacteroidetes bacterium HGW-Bacteroidetes-16]|jgi:phosphonate transport system substrate-binding protein|nr:MAG: phosphonate ABC transporter substrate-binding protein [Bacteroidetes bacterium HGW-Bacteroidetes-16]